MKKIITLSDVLVEESANRITKKEMEILNRCIAKLDARLTTLNDGWSERAKKIREDIEKDIAKL